MKPVIAVVAAGSMGAGVGGRLAARGAEVLTSLAGRSAATAERAGRAGMADAPDARLSEADFILSIVPPGEALGLAERLAPAIAETARRSSHRPLYVDCNAVSPRSVARIAGVLAEAGCDFVDGGIIGGPPKAEGAGPVFYVSGPEAGRAAALRDFGLRVTVLDGPVGAASAMKMSYAGITKGLTALGAAMVLGASRAGAADSLRAELGESQAPLLARLARGLPDMYGKAYRWVAEMEEIAEFLGEDEAARMMFQGAARLYRRLAEDAAGGRQEIAAMDAFLAPLADKG